MQVVDEETLANVLNGFYCRFNVNFYDCCDVLGAIRIDDSVSKL